MQNKHEAFEKWWSARVEEWCSWVHEPTRKDIGHVAFVAGFALAEKQQPSSQATNPES